jgi:hypothetical protein
MYLQLHAYQHHVFMDWRFVEDEKWREIYVALNGAGVESMQAKWEEMFGVKEEETSEKEVVKVRKPRKKAAPKKKVAEGDVTPDLQAEKKPRVRKSTTSKKTTAKNPETSDKE